MVGRGDVGPAVRCYNAGAGGGGGTSSDGGRPPTTGALFVGWGPTVRGREQQALQVFNETVQFFAGLQQQGEIAGLEPVALEPHYGDLYGFLLVRGDREALARLRAGEEFVRVIQRGDLVVERLGVATAYTDDDLARLFATLLAG